MILGGLKYKRNAGTSKEWAVEGKDGDLVRFGNINLLVGKNAAGKSRTLSVIKELGELLSTHTSIVGVKSTTASYEVLFIEDSVEYKYTLNLKKGEILAESLVIDGDLKFDRLENKIYSETQKKYIAIEPAKDMLITSLHTDEYPFLEELCKWGFSLRDSVFSDQVEKKSLAKTSDELDYKAITHGNIYTLFQIFKKGEDRFGDEFINRIKQDMAFVGYDIEEIQILESKYGYGIHVKEEELEELTSQLDMSQGMYRILSFIIRLNYAVMNKVSVCFLIDDLGEGLDFNRSKALISLIIRNLTDTSIQAFLTTNDRYIMNKIPLKYWSVVERLPKITKFYNYHNSKAIFEDFKYTGLNNFDFLATDFYLKGFEGQD